MNSRTRCMLALVGAFAVSLVACSRTPTAAPTRSGPGLIRTENGMGYGSGNRNGADSLSAATSSEITADVAPQNGGMGYGSGN